MPTSASVVDQGQQKLMIDVVSISPDSTIKIDVTFDLVEESVLYQWGSGYIWPLLSSALFVEVVSSTGESWQVEKVELEKAWPKVGHRLDKVVAKYYKYPHPLHLQILDPNGEPVKGCGDIRITYDMTRSEYWERRKIWTLLNLTSNRVKFCFPERYLDN
ncbi:MAG: hypothetical protein OEZ51_03495 [Nitrospinota bacterium]|nr:hypothetical protein [Nitrospinota bacterium]